MKWIPTPNPTLELTTRNLSALQAKLSDPLSARTLRSPCQEIIARAVEDDAAGSEELQQLRASEGVVEVTRSQLRKLLDNVGAAVDFAGIRVVSVPNSAHYADRDPGEVFVPSTGERY
jgi:hypothetical protein